MPLLLGTLYLAVFLYVLTLLARLVLDWIQNYARQYRPSGFVLVVFVVVYTLTDPPVKLLRRILPPLRLGMVSLDLSLLILLLLGGIVQFVLASML